MSVQRKGKSEWHYWCLIVPRGDLTRLNSRFGPLANPNFYRIDVSVLSPPGLYYVSDLRERTPELLNVESLVRAHATPICSVNDISESLASDILAKFPAATAIMIRFQPNIRKNFQIENLVGADLSFTKFSTCMKRATSEQNSEYRFKTEWHLPNSLQSGRLISLVLTTEERSISTFYDQIPGLEFPSCCSSLKYVHPTFGLHEEIARFAEHHQSDRAEGAGLLLAQCLFHLADKQTPCKRLQLVQVLMREVVPLTGAYRTRREQMVERIFENEFPNKSYTACNVQLDRRQYEQSQSSLLSSNIRSGRHRAYLALGSNLGNRVEMIESAVLEMSNRGLTVLRTSALYETKPMYLENQESFINGACEVCSTDVAANPQPR